MSNNTRYLLCGVAGAVLVAVVVAGLAMFGAAMLGYFAAMVAVGVPIGLWVRKNT